jgi:hypothetical protein
MTRNMLEDPCFTSAAVTGTRSRGSPQRRGPHCWDEPTDPGGEAPPARGRGEARQGSRCSEQSCGETWWDKDGDCGLGSKMLTFACATTCRQNRCAALALLTTSILLAECRAGRGQGIVVGPGIKTDVPARPPALTAGHNGWQTGKMLCFP